MNDLAALILAGGAGRRYGRPKAEATLPDGRTFLQSCFDTLLSAGANPIVATLPPGLELKPIKELRLVILSDPDLDMFGSILQGLKELVRHPDWSFVAVHPVDHPLVSSATIRALKKARAPASIPTLSGRHGHPICLSRSIAESIAEKTHHGPTLREVIKDAGHRNIDVVDPGVRANCNTPEALAAAWCALETDRSK